MPVNFSLAKALAYLLGEESSPARKALLALPMLGLACWFIASDKLPTQVEDAADTRQYHGKSVILQKELNVRGELVLAIKQGNLPAEKIPWGDSFFSSELTNDSFPTLSREDFLRLERYSLTAYAAAGDSLLKKQGELTATIRRGQQTKVFYFHSLWQ